MMKIMFKMDQNWMRFADLLVDTGVISDIVENMKPAGTLMEHQSGSKGATARGYQDRTHQIPVLETN